LEGVEQEVRVDLRAEGVELGLLQRGLEQGALPRGVRSRGLLAPVAVVEEQEMRSRDDPRVGQELLDHPGGIEYRPRPRLGREPRPPEYEAHPEARDERGRFSERERSDRVGEERREETA